MVMCPLSSAAVTCRIASSTGAGRRAASGGTAPEVRNQTTATVMRRDNIAELKVYLMIRARWCSRGQVKGRKGKGTRDKGKGKRGKAKGHRQKRLSTRRAASAIVWSADTPRTRDQMSSPVRVPPREWRARDTQCSRPRRARGLRSYQGPRT